MQAQQDVAELKEAMKTIQGEVNSFQIEPLVQMEHTVTYYDTMLDSLQILLKLAQDCELIASLT